MSVVVDQTFEQVLSRLSSYAANSGARMVLYGNVPWCGLDADGAVIDGFDHDAISAVFNRDGTSKLYLTP